MKRAAYRPRVLAPLVEAALTRHPVVVVSGARQTGKTTLVQHLPSARRRVYRTLDDLDALDFARKRPEDLLAAGKYLTLDEVQRVPELLLAIKRDVDQRRVRGRFLLTSSANLLLMREVADSLAGRAIYLLLSPFTSGEKRGDGTVPPWTELLACKKATDVMDTAVALPRRAIDWRQESLRGGIPPATLARSARERSSWFEGFVRTYLERDLRDMSNIASLPDFRRLMGLAVHRIGQLVNQTELGRDAGLSQATTHRYLNLLDVTFQTFRLPAFAASTSTRLIKAPKLYWTDVGLATHLLGLGLAQLKDVRSSRLSGALLENLVLASLLVWRETVHPRPEIHYWRTAGGAEVDFVIEAGNMVVPVEVKTKKRLRTSDLRHLEVFLTAYPKSAHWAVVLHDTDEARLITRNIVGLPIAQFL